ncbi:glycosyltransferase family 2 protein [Desulfurella amilsii]|uniref:glycosyltransferase family 2 protein n=1 Tax=Desulfurella amilsii TaxID=1562698 RepID=UPI0019509383|nr:glycosyltransferase family 2 protein [Desulfurella amilsii]
MIKILERLGLIQPQPYALWIRNFEPNNKALIEQRTHKFAYNPKISIIVTTLNTPTKILRDMLNSVSNQTYSNWQLCIADGSTKKSTLRMLKKFSKKDKRIVVKFLNENKGTAANLRQAIRFAAGEYVAFLGPFDTLAPFALFEIVKAISENPDTEFIYSDEDKISKNAKKRFSPHFKPDFSPDLLRSCNYISHLSVIKKQLLDKIGTLREDFEGSWDYDLILRCTQKAKKIIHIPKVLYHLRHIDPSVPKNIDAKKALSEHLERIGLKGTVEDLDVPGFYKINYDILGLPKISIIIPNKDHKEDLEKCINSILKSTYKNYEIIIAENNSTDKITFEYYDYLKNIYSFIKVIEWGKPFNYSAINNFAVLSTTGDILLFLNNDIEPINNNWLEEMLMFVQRDDVGAVGAKLFYPNNTIQHAGVIIGLGGVADHSHKYFPGDANGYFMRLKIVQNVSAVTGACLMTKKSVFMQVGGFDELYQIAFNDIDFCLKIRQKGYLIVFTPFAKAYHFESKTRGIDDTFEKKQRFNKEKEMFIKNWKEILVSGDPYYKPNLTLYKFDFSPKII